MKVVKTGGITLANGLLVPRGATITTAQWSVHHDDDIYPRAHEYDPYRFHATVHSPTMVTTSAEYLVFGHGKHSWFVLSYRTL